MRILKSILTFIGLVTIVAGLALFYNIWSATKNFDPDAFGLYTEFVGKLLKTQDLADAFVWAVPVEEGIEAEEVKESLKSLAVARNFLFVNDSPFYKQVKAVTGQDFRHVSFMQFCDVKVGMKMLAYNNAYSAFMPCVISIVEDEDGKVWLYSMNMDFLIHGAKELPPDLKREAIKVRSIMREIMEGAATGEF
ncbi:MAG: DUF302 domain-containing protein [Gammaproteobacteria bacterium]|nr:DUF302 domain-containing protein [Gammaproteobacteria bacterium]